MSENIDINLLFNAVDHLSSAVGNMKNALGGFQAATEKTTEKTGVLQQAISTAAGVIIRDLVRSFASSIQETVTLGAKIESLNASFKTLVRTTGGTELSLQKLREATRGTVADVDLLKAANTAMTLGLPTDELDELMESAMKLGRALGISTLEAVNSLSIGIGRQSRLVLDNLGVIVNSEQAYKWYADSIGKTVSQLSESEKRLGWQAYAIEQVTRKAEQLGDVQDGAISSQERWNATLKNFQTEIGKALTPLSGFISVINPLIPALSMMAVQVLPSLLTSLTGATSAMGAFRIATSAMLGPIGLIITAIGAFALAYTTNFGGFRYAVDDLVSGFTASSRRMMDEIRRQRAVLDEEYGRQIETIQGRFSESISALESGYAEQTATMERELDEQLRVTNQFYDDMLAEARQYLDDIQDRRSEELDALELAYLLEQEALEKALQNKEITEEEYNTRMQQLEETYRDNRETITRSWRIKELQAEKQYAQDEERINQERADEIEQIQKEHQAEMERMKRQYETDMNKITEEQKLAQLKAESAYWASKAALDRSMMEEMKNEWRNWTFGTVQQWEIMLDNLIKGVVDLYNKIVGHSVWPKMFDEMVEATKKGVGQITSEFQKLTPDITTTFPQAYTPATVASPSPIAGLREITINNYIGQITGDYDARRMAEEAYRKLVKLLGNKY